MTGMNDPQLQQALNRITDKIDLLINSLPERYVTRIEFAAEVNSSLEAHENLWEKHVLDLNSVKKDIQNLRHDVDSTTDWLVWAQRIVIGAVIMGLLTLVIIAVP